MGAKPKTAVLKSATSKAAKSKAATPKKAIAAKKPGPGGPSFDTSVHLGWSSGELQSQIGTKNKDKKKLVMEVWYDFWHDTASTFKWSVSVRIKAEDKNLSGSGWSPANALASFTYNFQYKQGSAAAVTKTGSAPVSGQADVTKTLFSGSAGSSSLLPVLLAKHATGARSGGPSGIQIVL